MPEYKRPRRFRFAHFKIESYTPSQKEAFLLFVHNNDFESYRYVRAHIIAGRRSATGNIPRCMHLFMLHGKHALTERTWKSMIPKQVLEKGCSFEPVDAQVRKLMEKMHDDPYNAFEKVIGTPPHQGISHTMYHLRKQAEELGLDHSNIQDETSLREFLEMHQQDMEELRQQLAEEYENAKTTPQTRDHFIRFPRKPMENRIDERPSSIPVPGSKVSMSSTRHMEFDEIDYV